MQQFLKVGAGILLLLTVCFASYRHPVEDDFDRFVYEAIVLGKTMPIGSVYAIVKHENKRAEASSIMDSPQHLKELEPLYAIRPLYLLILSWVGHFLPLPRAISLVAAASYFLLGLVAIAWTRRPILAALLMSAYPLLVLARVGTPDSLAALLVIAGLWLLDDPRHQIAGLILLFLSLGSRTDNLLLLLAVLIWLVWAKRLSLVTAAVLGMLALGVVFAINHFAGNYGWIVLFRYSFLESLKSPAEVPDTLTLREYISALLRGSAAIAVHLTLWILLGILAWMRRRDPVLIVAAAASAVHFLMFPSPEDRYFVWAYIVAGIALIRSFQTPLPGVARTAV